MDAVELHGTPLVEDPARVGHVRALGIDETSFLSATREHATLYATGMVDLDDPKVIDMIEGNSAADLRRWCAAQDPLWLETIEVVATDLAESYRRGIAGHLDHTVRVADPFHVVRAANRVVDKVRRRVQNETLGHRGRKADPLYRIRSSSSPAPSVSTSAATNACCSGCAEGTPTTSCSGPGWPITGPRGRSHVVSNRRSWVYESSKVTFEACDHLLVAADLSVPRRGLGRRLAGADVVQLVFERRYEVGVVTKLGQVSQTLA